MAFVFERSRPGKNTRAARTAARNVPCVSGSSFNASVSCAASSSRSVAIRVFWPNGATPSGDRRMRSTAASARSGCVSHVGERISHSFGPRDPKL